MENIIHLLSNKIQTRMLAYKDLQRPSDVI